MSAALGGQASRACGHAPDPIRAMQLQGASSVPPSWFVHLGSNPDSPASFELWRGLGAPRCQPLLAMALLRKNIT